MNKSELISFVAKMGGLSKKDAEKAVNAVCAAVTNALAGNDNVQIIGFGTFEVKQHNARQGRNPKTGEIIDIPACKAVSFKAGKSLKEAVNQ